MASRLRLSDWMWVLAPLPVYVFLSSWFGLTRDSMFHASGGGPFGDPARFFGSVWQANVGADILFALGSAAVGFGALLAVVYTERRFGPLSSFAAVLAGGFSILANWLVYGLSFMGMFYDWYTKSGPNSPPASTPSFGDSMHFVWDWGWPSIVWVTSLFPLVLFGALQVRRAMRPGWVEVGTEPASMPPTP